MLTTIDTIIIALAVSNKQSLFILLGKSGAIQCMGDGSLNNKDKTIYIGKTSTDIFENLQQNINPQWLQRCGRYTVPKRQGKECELSIIFRCENDEKGMQFIYGSDSQGPPPDITHFVHVAVNLITPWHTLQQQQTKN